MSADGPLQPLHITSRDNPLVVRLRELSRDTGAYRKLGELWLEGAHLCEAARRHGVAITQAVLSEAAWSDSSLRALVQGVFRVALLPEPLFRSLSALESPGRIGFVIALPPDAPRDPGACALVLDRLQDPGNAGSILRSAAALGVTQVWASRGTVALWSPKVLRAGMGAHFALKLSETLSAGDIALEGLPLVATSSHHGVPLHAARLPWPCAWVFGNEGQGIHEQLVSRCALTVRIEQRGEESLNVAAAAAICLYESERRR